MGDLTEDSLMEVVGALTVREERLQNEIERLTAEVGELKESYHRRLGEEIDRIRDEFRVKSVCEDRDGVYYQLRVLASDRTPEGLMVVVST